MRGCPGYSRQYVAPEVLHAVKSDAEEYRVTGAEDIWALGIIAFELLTFEPAFPLGLTVPEIEAQILGHEAAPWEVQSSEINRKLRGLRKSVMACLHRNPTQRPTSLQVLESWNHIFDTIKSRNEQVR
jgi:serine/threonine protein kinase